MTQKLCTIRKDYFLVKPVINPDYVLGSFCEARMKLCFLIERGFIEKRIKFYRCYFKNKLSFKGSSFCYKCRTVETSPKVTGHYVIPNL